MKYKNRFLGIAILCLVVLSICFLLSINVFAFSSSNIGNSSSNIADKYAFGDNIRGWINISLTNEYFNSLLRASYSPSAAESNITIRDLLAKNPNVPYNCSTAECGLSYEATDSGSSSRSFTLDAGQSILLGMLINDSQAVTDVSNFYLNITSDASDDCLSQLKVDVNDDGIYEWFASKPKENSYCSRDYGCYSPSADKITMINQDYCESINISSAAALFLGANVSNASGALNANFNFFTGGQTCQATATESGETGCRINLTINEPTTLNVCMRQTSGSYQLYYENANPCGSSGGAFLDFSIFAQPLKFDAIENVLVNASNEGNKLARTIDDYINNKYGRDCSAGCYVPIKIYSNKYNQHITINSAKINYATAAGGKDSSNIYNISQMPSRISMPFKALNLDSSGLKAPRTAGIYNLTLTLGGTFLLKKQISVLTVPVVESIYPLEAPAGAQTKFWAVTSGANVTRYKWGFGDNTSSVTTTSNYATHKYGSLGTYTLSLTVENAQGNSSGSFSVKAISPGNYLNSSLIAYRGKINKLRSQINTLPAAVKSYIEQILNLTETETSIVGLQAQFNAAGSDTLKQISILDSLFAINLPESINITERAAGDFLITPSMINPADLYAIASETQSAGDAVVRDSVLDWFIKSLNVNATLNVYSLIYRNLSTPSASYVEFKITPQKPLGKVYAIINEPSSDLDLGSQAAGAITAANAVGVPLDFSGTTSQKSLAFLIKKGISFLDLPVYFSPSPSELSLITNVSACNFNGVCEENENSENCRSDCPAWGGAIVWIIIILIAVFCLYIAAQEWYKRKYESYLFKDKNDLFNLIHFMDNAEKQGMKKEDIFKKLSEKNWPNEQMVYAYKKYKGERTGMWEIPIFKFLENKKVGQQLEIRKKLGINPNIVPKPIKPFIRFSRPSPAGPGPMPAKPAEQPRQQPVQAKPQQPKQPQPASQPKQEEKK